MGKIHSIFVFGNIDPKMSQSICQQIAKIALLAKDDDQLAMIIKSNGGYAGQAYEIINALIDLNLPIITVGHQTVASAATLLLASGHIRLITPHTDIIHHHVRVKLNLDSNLFTAKNLLDLATTLVLEVEKISAEEKKVFLIATRDSLLTPKKLKKMIEQSNGKDIYFNARQAKELGLVHDIIPSIRALPTYLKTLTRKAINQ